MKKAQTAWRQLRGRKMSAAELAIRAGIAANTICRIQSGDRRASPKLAKPITLATSRLVRLTLGGRDRMRNQSPSGITPPSHLLR